MEEQEKKTEEMKEMVAGRVSSMRGGLREQMARVSLETRATVLIRPDSSYQLESGYLLRAPFPNVFGNPKTGFP